MKASELKLRIQKTLDSMIDVYYGDNTLIDKFVNTTLKVLVNTNIHKLDGVMKYFEDKDGNIDTVSIINAYADNLTDEGVKFDIRNYIDDDTIKNLLPDKYLIVCKDDILKIISDIK